MKESNGTFYIYNSPGKGGRLMKRWSASQLLKCIVGHSESSFGDWILSKRGMKEGIRGIILEYLGSTFAGMRRISTFQGS